MWGIAPDRSWVGNDWTDKTPGFRKTHKSGVSHSGEQVLEHKLLGNRGHLKLHTLVDKRKGEAVYPLVAVYNNMPWTRIKKGQVISDAFGLVVVGKEVHPLPIEVKVTDKNCWAALVQVLKQLKLARYCEAELTKFTDYFHLPPAKGAWGMVLAPTKYFAKDEDKLTDSLALMEALSENRRTDARVVFASADSLDSLRIDILYGNWRIKK